MRTMNSPHLIFEIKGGKRAKPTHPLLLILAETPTFVTGDGIEPIKFAAENLCTTTNDLWTKYRVRSEQSSLQNIHIWNGNKFFGVSDKFIKAIKPAWAVETDQTVFVALSKNVLSLFPLGLKRGFFDVYRLTPTEFAAVYTRPDGSKVGLKPSDTAPTP